VHSLRLAKSTKRVVREIPELIKTKKINDWYTSGGKVKLAFLGDDIIPVSTNLLLSIF